MTTRRSGWNWLALAALCAAGGASALAQGAKKKVPADQPPARKEAPRPAPTQSEQVQQPPLTVQVGTMEITAPDIEFDNERHQQIFRGGVQLLTPNSRMLADEMTVQTTPNQELEWAHCEGDVIVWQKNEKDGTIMEAWCRTFDRNELKKQSTLLGDVLVHQTATSLAKPAIITGARVDMDDVTKVNIVHRSSDAQAKVHIEPKGEEGRPKPEPLDLFGDKIEMNSATQMYTSTGDPRLQRPSTKMVARRIRFEVDQKSHELKVAYGDDDVVYDDKTERGTVVHATGARGVYTKETSDLVMEGNVHATTLDPGQVVPNIYDGEIFTYNSKTGRGRLHRSGPVPSSMKLPQNRNSAAAPGEGPAPGTGPRATKPKPAPPAPVPAGDPKDAPAPDSAGKKGDNQGP